MAASKFSPASSSIKLPSKIDDLLAMGVTIHSPNRKWTVGYRDPGPTLVHESVVRLRNNETREICTTVRSLVRPIAVDVSDEGVWVVDDAGPASELSSTVVVFDSSGAELYRRAYRANLMQLTISPCGRYIASVTANAPNEDSHLLEIHNVSKGKVLFSRTPAIATQCTYIFEFEENQLVKVFAKVPKLGRFAYAASGEFLDAKRYLKARLTKGSFSDRILAGQELIGADPSETALRQALESVEVAIGESKESRSWHVSGLLLKGRICNSLGQLNEAIRAFEAAHELNPRAISRKRINALANRLAS
ncbi:tetratricopeptide repeat protein [Caballeronia sp. TF1N1]|uniref:tetratricopeptide repeat protein n=1 Tax=Caballeronia sp. TF1N1 TaxID=2878153 RepID=UPI001FCFD063|nr:tetratricopeptide repeat protein [Caballeronia sp. TF1N1]